MLWKFVVCLIIGFITVVIYQWASANGLGNGNTGGYYYGKQTRPFRFGTNSKTIDSVYYSIGPYHYRHNANSTMTGPTIQDYTSSDSKCLE